jgi:hypothetical protein
MAAVVSARRALRHRAFGLQDRRQARQSVQECFEPVWSGKDARQRLAALLRPLKRPDRIMPAGVWLSILAGRPGAIGSGWIDIGGREWNDASWSDRHSSPCTGRIGLSRFDRYEKSHIDPVWRRDRRGGAIGSGRCVPMIPATTCRRICTPECATGRCRQNVGILHGAQSRSTRPDR